MKTVTNLGSHAVTTSVLILRQQLVCELTLLETLQPTLSAARIATYMNAAGHKEETALALYLWNVELGETFHLPLQAVEISLRNRINEVVSDVFTADWWKADNFCDVADKKQLQSIDEVKRRLKKRGLDLNTGQVVAGLSFGFWVSLLGPRFNPPVWSARLGEAFPNLPDGMSRKAVQSTFRGIADFRNRIWHHEPIFKANLTTEYSHCIRALGWLCADQVDWVKPRCRVMTVLRQRPKG